MRSDRWIVLALLIASYLAPPAAAARGPTCADVLDDPSARIHQVRDVAARIVAGTPEDVEQILKANPSCRLLLACTDRAMWESDHARDAPQVTGARTSHDHAVGMGEHLATVARALARVEAVAAKPSALADAAMHGHLIRQVHLWSRMPVRRQDGMPLWSTTLARTPLWEQRGRRGRYAALVAEETTARLVTASMQPAQLLDPAHEAAVAMAWWRWALKHTSDRAQRIRLLSGALYVDQLMGARNGGARPGSDIVRELLRADPPADVLAAVQSWTVGALRQLSENDSAPDLLRLAALVERAAPPPVPGSRPDADAVDRATAVSVMRVVVAVDHGAVAADIDVTGPFAQFDGGRRSTPGPRTRLAVCEYYLRSSRVWEQVGSEDFLDRLRQTADCPHEEPEPRAHLAAPSRSGVTSEREPAM